MRQSGLEQLNGLIGFCRTMPGWPDPLRVLGYDIDGIETPIVIGIARQVTPDLILTSTAEDHAIAFELKEGGNVDLEQARKLASLNPAHLASQGIRVSAVDSAIVCDDAEHVRVSKALAQAQISLPVFGMSTSMFQLRSGSLSNSTLGAALNRLSLRGKHAPRFFAVLPTSDESAYIPVLSAILTEKVAVAEASGEVVHLHRDGLCAELFPGDLWGYLPNKEQGAARNKVQNAMTVLVAGPFKGKIERAPSGRWRVAVQPARSGTGRARMFQAIPRRVAKVSRGKLVIPQEQMLLPLDELYRDEEDGTKP